MLIVMTVLGIAIFLAAGFVGWRKRVRIQVWLNDRQLVRHAIFWAIMATVYVGLLTLGGYLRHGNFMLTVSVIFAIIAVAGKKSLNQFGTHDFYQIAQISVLVVAIVGWLWPTVALVATLPFIFALVWALNVMPDRWPEFAGTWGRKIVYRSIQVVAFIMVSWTVFKFTFPEMAPALGEWTRKTEHAAAMWAKNPSFGAGGTSKAKPVPASAPVSRVDISSSQAAVKAMPKRGLMSKDELAKLSENLSGDRIPVMGKPPTVAEVVAQNPTGKAPPLPAVPASEKRPKPAKSADILQELETEFPD